MMEESRIKYAEDEALYPKEGQNQRILLQRKGTLLDGRNVLKIMLIVITVVTILTLGMNIDVYSRQKESTQGPPRITLAPRDQKVVDDGIVSFFCKAAGNPAPDIYWRKNGNRISSHRIRFLVVDMPHGSVLRIEPVRANRHNTDFECVADNGIGTPATAMASLEVYPEGTMPQGYPEISEHPHLKVAEMGKNTIMVCTATGNPDPEIMWLKDFTPVDLQDPRLTLLPTGALQITSSQESDEGKYECIAENPAGVAYSYGGNLYVRVRRVPPHFSVLPETHTEVMPGGAVNLTCAAVGSPMPYVKWQLGALELTELDNIPVGQNVLQLTNIKESANFTCVATSDLGNIEAVATVHVEETDTVTMKTSSARSPGVILSTTATLTPGLTQPPLSSLRDEQEPPMTISATAFMPSIGEMFKEKNDNTEVSPKQIGIYVGVLVGGLVLGGVITGVVILMWRRGNKRSRSTPPDYMYINNPVTTELRPQVMSSHENTGGD